VAAGRSLSTREQEGGGRFLVRTPRSTRALDWQEFPNDWPREDTRLADAIRMTASLAKPDELDLTRNKIHNHLEA